MDKRKKLLSLIFGLCMTVFVIPAQGKTFNLVLWTREGPKISFAFTDKPKVTIVGKVFKVTSSKTNVDCRARDMDQFTIEEGNEESEIIAPQASLPQVKLLPGQLSLTGCRPGSLVEIVSADGKKTDSSLTDDNGSLRLDIGSYGKGIIIVKTETTSLKIINK